MELEIQTMQPGERLYAYRQSTQLLTPKQRFQKERGEAR